jgi:hypothetical protein
MKSTLLDHNTPPQVLHHVVNDAAISLADFRALTLAVNKSAPFCYFNHKGQERDKEDILRHIESSQPSSSLPKLLFGIPLVALRIDDHKEAHQKVTEAQKAEQNINSRYVELSHLSAKKGAAYKAASKRIETVGHSTKTQNEKNDEILTILEQYNLQYTDFFNRELNLETAEDKLKAELDPQKKTIMQTLNDAEQKLTHTSICTTGVALALAFSAYAMHQSTKKKKRQSLAKALSRERREPVLPSPTGKGTSYDEESEYANWIAGAYPSVHDALCNAKTVLHAQVALTKLSKKDYEDSMLSSIKKYSSQYLIRTDGQLRNSLDEIGRAFFHFQRGVISNTRGTVRRWFGRRKTMKKRHHGSIRR